jgi:N-acyl homoserine lactone hydrolase
MTEIANLGHESTHAALVESLKNPGPIYFEKITGANWQVPLSGLLNLDHPKAVSEGLVDKPEDIQLFLYVIRHPSKGSLS